MGIVGSLGFSASILLLSSFVQATLIELEKGETSCILHTASEDSSIAHSKKTFELEGTLVVLDPDTFERSTDSHLLFSGVVHTPTGHTSTSWHATPYEFHLASKVHGYGEYKICVKNEHKGPLTIRETTFIHAIDDAGHKTESPEYLQYTEQKKGKSDVFNRSRETSKKHAQKAGVMKPTLRRVSIGHRGGKGQDEEDETDVELLEDDDYYSGQLSDEAATKEQSQAVVALAQAIGKDYNRIQDDLNSMTTRMSRHEVTTRSNLGRVSFFGWLEVVGFMLLGGANVLIVMSFFSDSAKTTGARRRGGLRY